MSVRPSGVVCLFYVSKQAASDSSLWHMTHTREREAAAAAALSPLPATKGLFPLNHERAPSFLECAQGRAIY